MDKTQAMEAVMKRAAGDADFRALALKDGADAIRQVGGTLADGETVTFSETDLPIGDAGGELSDDALDQVAGGSTGVLYGSSYYCGGGSPSGRY